MAEKKTVKKAAPKKEVVKKEEKVVKCECNCNEGMLKNIFYALVVANIILAMIFVVLLVKNNGVTNTGSSTTEESSEEYDVSMFDELTTDQAIAQIKKGDLKLVYIGRSTCGYCVKFLPNLQKAQKEFGYKTIYVDLEKITSEDQAKWAEFGGVLKTYDESCQNVEDATVATECGQFGFTPMMLVFEDGKLKDRQVGYSEYGEFASFLQENGF